MEQTSKLSIVVDTRNAQKQIQSFSTQLKSMERDGLRFNKSLSKLGSSTQFGGMVASIKSAQSALQAFTGTAKNSATALNEFNIAAKSLRTATEGIAADINLAQSAMTKFASASKVVATGLQSVSVAAGQTKTNLSSVVSSLNLASSASGKLSATTKSTRADLLALNVTLTASGNALGKLGQASSAVNTKLSSFNGANFNSLSNSINAAKASLTAFTNTANNMAVAMNQAAKSSAALRAATKGISTNLNAVASASAKISNISSGIDKARVSSGKLGSVIRDVNKNVLTLNATLNTGTAALNRYSQAAITAGQRLNIFGQAATQTQTRLRGLDAGLIAARTNMTQMQTAANGINAIFGNLNTTMARLATATNALNTATTRANTAINQLGGNASNANAQAKGLMGTLSSLQGVLMGSIGSLAGFGILKTADEMQNLNSQIKNITNSESEYLLVKQRVQAIADKNYNDVNATTGLYASSARALANLGKSQVEALDFTNAVALAMRTGGRSAGEQASAITQLGQAMGANVVQGDEFRSLAENAPILLELVAKRLGVLPGQLKALAADGKITGEVMFDALTQNVNMLEEMAKKMPLTMSQAFTVAKNRYKTYVDSMMNETGGMSGKIASMIGGISANFDTMAKVAIASVGLAFLGVVTNVNLATRAMVLFNAVANANPVLLIVGGFLALSSAIYGANEVLTISGLVVGDFFTGLAAMIDDAKKWWSEYSNSVAVAMGGTVKSVEEANEKQKKSFLSLYKGTEEGFAGLVQHIGTNVGSVAAIFGTFFKVIWNWVENTLSIFDNMGKAAYNAGVNVRKYFGGDGETVEYSGYADKTLNPLEIYKATYKGNADFWENKAISWNQRAGVTPTPLDRQFSTKQSRGLSFSNATVAGKNSVLANTPAGLPDWLKPAATLSGAPIDAQKALQATMLKQQLATEANTEALKKSKAAQDKIDRAAGKGLSNRLVGISGDTGVGKAHLHVQYRDKSRAVSAADLARFKVGGKSVTDYKMTSGYGKRNTGIKGASTNHKGTDFGVKKNTPITTNVAVRNVKTWNDPKGGGYVSTITFEDGVVIDLLHQMPSVMGVEKGSSTGNKQIDSMVAKAEGNIASEAKKAEQLAKKLADDKVKALELAAREAERIRQAQLGLVKEYGDADARLAVEHGERIEKIREANLPKGETDALIAKSKERMDRDLAVYENGLQDKVNALNAYQQTEAAMLARERDGKQFDLRNDIELSRAENSELLQLALDSVDAEYEYKLERYQLALSKEKNELSAFKQTERQIWQSGWDSKIADAIRATDELASIRLGFLLEQKDQEDALMKLTQEQKLLELNKTHMTELAYIREKYRLESELINSSNEDPEIKEAQLRELKTPSNLALKGVLEGMEQETPLGKIQADYEARIAVIEQYEQEHTDMIGVQTAARLAVEQSYMDAKRDLMLGTSQEIFGGLSGLAKSFAGEQSGIYRAMFAIEKGIALARTLLAAKTAMALAWASAPFPYNIAAVATAAVQTGALSAAVSAISPKGFKAGGYTGNMGASQVAGVVHGQEYVFDAQSTKNIGVDNLNAMRRGDKVGGDVQVNIINNSSARVTSSDDGQTITIEDVRNENKRSWTNLSNPNSFESKQLNRNIQAPRRR